MRNSTKLVVKWCAYYTQYTGSHAGVFSESNVHSLHCLRFLKFAHLLDVIHEITTIHVLHHKIQTVLEKEWERERDRGSHFQILLWEWMLGWDQLLMRRGLAENECGNEWMGAPGCVDTNVISGFISCLCYTAACTYVGSLFALSTLSVKKK